MPKVIDLPTSTSMSDSDYLIMEASGGGTKKITKANVDGVSTSSLTVASGFSVVQSMNNVYKTGRVAQFVFWISGTIGTSGTLVGTLPSGFRPVSAFMTPMLDFGGNTIAIAQVSLNGEIRLYKTADSSTSFRLTATYIAA